MWGDSALLFALWRVRTDEIAKNCLLNMDLSMAKVNKVVRISLSGGIIGWLTTNPRKALDNRLKKENADGWNAVYFSNHFEANLFVKILSIVVLCLTLFMWTWGAGYLVLFEKEIPK